MRRIVERILGVEYERSVMSGQVFLYEGTWPAWRLRVVLAIWLYRRGIVRVP